jgi:hypothetical protein
MDTAPPVPDPNESRSIGQDAETLRFQRLERVRARQRARRRQRLILVTVVMTTLAGIGILGFTKRHAVSTAGGKPAAPSATSAIAPAPTGDGELKREAATPPRVPLAATSPGAAALPVDAPPPAPHSPAPPAGRSGGATAPPRAEPRDAEAGDSTAAIDWLLKTSRTGSR